MLSQAPEPTLLNLATGLLDEVGRHVLQHHRVQREAAGPLPWLNEAASAQAIEGFQYLHTRRLAHQQGEQLLETHRLAHNGQPEEQRLLQGREPADLLREQVGETAKNRRALGEKGSDLASEEIGDG